MNDEDMARIAAYLDGELAEDARQAFERKMAADPQLASTVAEWRENDATLRAAFPEPETPNDPLAALIMSRQAPAVAESNVVHLSDVRARRTGSGVDWRWTGAIAASVLAMVGVAGWVRSSDPGAAPADPVMVALASTPSGQTTTTRTGTRVTPLLTVATRDGYCREFTVETAQARRTAVACSADGAWRIQRSGPASANPEHSGYATAAGADPAVLDALYRKLGAGDPLAPDAERAAMAKGWRR